MKEKKKRELILENEVKALKEKKDGRSEKQRTVKKKSSRNIGIEEKNKK